MTSKHNPIRIADQPILFMFRLLAFLTNQDSPAAFDSGVEPETKPSSRRYRGKAYTAYAAPLDVFSPLAPIIP